MRGSSTAGLGGLVALALVCAPAVAPAASFDCNAPRLRQAERAICADAQLSRLDDQLARRLADFTRRLTFGQYLGLRYWHARWQDARIGCENGRPCLAATYRSQARLLDRLEQCLDSSVRRRTCLQTTFDEREAQRR
jgi:uncharacterized protein